ncbi:MAG TPA: [NiFe]-hydrogenase assembly chaperone HybE [Candidatus Omnitrophota bacterium]|nr:[NiFe]-hydrogenase assembly chaperone HybE [Candidatus Omnitrophota bacterium]
MTTLAADDLARVDRLVEQFTRIGDERMRDLGLYNPALRVEAIGFRRWEGWLAGVLVTPWFMNFMLLPTAAEQLAGFAVGTKRRIEMPKGEVVFTIGEVEEIGPYAANSLHSPMGEFGDHLNAAARAWALVETFFQEPKDEATTPCGR